VESVQSPERPYAVELIELYGAGKLDDALRLFEEFQPRHQAFFDLQAMCIARGAHPTVWLKYHQWLTGGNVGLIPTPAHAAAVQPPLDASARQAVRDSYAEVGIPVRDAPDEEFFVGRAQYERGVRAHDLELELGEVYSTA
jgi:4-hydroxy-tetrahydrodipicolinate synthase